MRTLLCLIALALAAPAWGQTAFERFQLFNYCNAVDLGVSVELNQDEDSGLRKLSLAEEQVRTAVEARLRSARLYDSEAQPYVFAIIHVYNATFNARVEFNKPFWDLASVERGLATTWRVSSTGTHGGNGSYILSWVGRHVDQFLVEYLRVNEEACE